MKKIWHEGVQKQNAGGNRRSALSEKQKFTIGDGIANVAMY